MYMPNKWFATFPRDAQGKNQQPAFEAAPGSKLPAWCAAFLWQNEDGWHYRVPADSIATNGGKGKSPRMEFREAKNGQSAFWALKDGVTFTYDFRVVTYPGGPYRFVVGQIHNKENEPMKIFVEPGKVYVGEDISNRKFPLIGDAGTSWHKVKVVAKGTKITVTLDSTTISYTQKDDGKNYLKIGCYFVGAALCTGDVIVAVKNLKFTHP
jgi:hypothetical protein